MGCTLELEIENLKQEVEELKALVNTLVPGELKLNTLKPRKKIQAINISPEKMIDQKMDELCTLADNRSLTGAITYMGVFSSGEKQSNWVKDGVNTDQLLTLAESHAAERVLGCIGNSSRLNILLALLKKPMSVAELLTECHLNSTGQAYHHMKPLLAADLIAEDSGSKGTYFVPPHKVQGIVMLLAGISDMVDEKHSKGILNA